MPYLDAASAHQTSACAAAIAVLRARAAAPDEPPHVVDVGCGDGRSKRDLAPAGAMRWTGIDIATSPEAVAARSTGETIVYYDGVHLPLEAASADLVYSRQVFEHVRHPEALVVDIARVLKPGGWFVGSVSHLEPYHSESICNFTPYGFARILEDNGFSQIRVRPGIDGFSLIARRALAYLRIRLDAAKLEQRSPGNVLMDLVGRLPRVSPERVAALKLLFSGHFVFVAMRDPR